MAFSFFKRNTKKDHADSTDGAQPAHTVNQVVMVPLDNIVPNRFQPRKHFNDARIAELADTIKEHGLLQPIVLREYEADHYEIIAGERRYRAVRTLHWQDVPAIVQKMNDEETASMALVENLQREQLSPIEQARAYAALMKLNDLTQEGLAEQMGKSQSFVANKLRLLKLSDAVQEALMDGTITERHGRALLQLDDLQQQLALHKVLQDSLNVKETEELVDHLLNPTPAVPSEPQPAGEQEETPAAPAESSADRPAEASAADPESAPATAEKSEKPHRKPRRRIRSAHSTDPRVAINTIKKSVAMVQEAGVPIKFSESDDASGHHIQITVPLSSASESESEAE
ncbi:nucleoid occlusion protein [Schleiferilactobacillus shenzhenensis]|uniref:Noc n=1 Tax=Schleiferilactobacillus shenzhenensis LY-73 TaxID=1231336 RepID=U4TMH1_9LACO|nr:Noc [Schleiferilactobacillus shenzhenensis LY-73]